MLNIGFLSTNENNPRPTAKLTQQKKPISRKASPKQKSVSFFLFVV